MILYSDQSITIGNLNKFLMYIFKKNDDVLCVHSFLIPNGHQCSI